MQTEIPETAQQVAQRTEEEKPSEAKVISIKESRVKKPQNTNQSKTIRHRKISITYDIKSEWGIDITKPNSYGKLSAEGFFKVWRKLSKIELSNKKERLIFEQIKLNFLGTFEKRSRELAYSEGIVDSKDNFHIANLKLLPNGKEFLSIWILGSELIKMIVPFDPNLYTDEKIEEMKSNKPSPGHMEKNYRL